MGHEAREIDMCDRGAIARCAPALAVLRPHLSEERIVEQAAAQAAEGYALVCALAGGEIGAVAGYRFATFLAWGRVLYIDDLIALPQHRRMGLGGALLDWLIARARTERCASVHLDTGHERYDAHRLYLQKGFRITSHHVSLVLA